MPYRDVKGNRDRGPREFKTHLAESEGEVMTVATKDVVTVSPNTAVKKVARLMEENDFRRIPVTDAGTGRLGGIVSTMDILDFFGGGQKYNIITDDYEGNIAAAVNCPVRKIMNKNPMSVRKSASIDDVVRIILEKKTSSIPVVEDQKVIAIVTERDVLPSADNFGISVREVMQKKCIASSKGMMVSDVSKIMVRNRMRRLPVMLENSLIGVVTVFDVLEFIGEGKFKSIDAEKALSTRVDEIMEKNVMSVSPDTDIAEVSRLVTKTGIGGFPVIENERLLGIITTSDIIRGVREK
ncbi:MAG: hypothetical protein MSIBF_01600 [Candidatus Altiarchaeales archaeon IMC4]|nr:MAG: hypothetical protein MSIBF_01600 [Candidatus Altiarchaeales archaeon IMC4]